MLKKKFTHKKVRYGELDFLRGLAIAMMIAYHFCYDLSWMGWTHWRLLETPGWIVWRNSIVTLFLLIAGIAFNLHKNFWWRWAQIFAAALLVSAASFGFAGERFIYFGILHFVAMALLIARVCRSLGIWNIALGLLVITAGVSYQHPHFDPILWNWLGFATHKPNTEDYVPLFPWLGVLLLGMGLSSGLGARWLSHNKTSGQNSATFLPSSLRRTLAALPIQVSQFLQFLGRWPLSIYLLHQPILLGAMLSLKTFS